MNMMEDKIAKIVSSCGIVKLENLQNSKTVASLLRKGVLYNPMEGYVAVAELSNLVETKKVTFVVNPESIDWGKPIIGKSAKSAAKGAFFITKDSKNEAYKFLSGSLSEALSKGEHKISSGGFDYWFNFGGGIARRPMKQ